MAPVLQNLEQGQQLEHSELSAESPNTAGRESPRNLAGVGDG